MVVFDFDGVIADSLGICTRACIHAARQQGCTRPLAENPFTGLEQVSFEGLAAELGLDTRAFAADACSYLENCQEIAPVFPGMAETLRQVASNGALCILSASPRSTIEPFLRFHGCYEHVSVILSRDIPGGKAGKLKALQREALEPVICMVGDGVSDISAAKQAGIPSVAVAWGWQAPDVLRKAGADFIADTPGRIVGILEAL
ncbi:HAD family hydrolase [Leisingera daeponensis]|uniref:phosphoglycolate phosphatase n=1 Tax=Leisingera daeponensis TaxID=405746 RepID=A0ABS7NLP5_9RHOB|nr:HAD family hydrolase [Leisingera daeponensis]MBY6142120.1 HAD family hydrolase [Leisingera daeponensis]